MAGCPSTSILCFLLYCVLTTINASPLVQSQYASAASAHPHQYILSPDFEITDKPKTRKYTFHVTESTAALDGFLRPVLAINGQIPGPLIEANEGDHLEITVVNQMSVGLTLHWHGIYQNGTNWEDGVTGVTQCPIPADGGSFTYTFDLHGQFGTFWYHSHHQNLMADGINGPLIIHSPRDPLKRHVDFDQDVVLILADWYHNTSTDIVEHMLSEAGYFGTPAAPGPNSALINGIGEWNCSQASKAQQCKQINPPPEFTFKAGDKIRFRLINAGVHAMFFYSVDEHTLNVTEADGTGVYGPPALHRVWLHNGQRYSVVIKTKKEDAGKSFYLRATMDSDCWAWVPDDIQLTGFGILRLVDDESKIKKISQSQTRPQTKDWPDEILGDCIDLPTSSLVPILKESVPNSVVGSGSFKAGFGFQFINNTALHLTRAQAVKLAQKVNASSLSLTTNPRTEELQTTNDTASFLRNGTARTLLNARSKSVEGLWNLDESESLTALAKRQVSVGQKNLPPGNRTNMLGITRTGGPPPTPAGTIGKFFLNNISWTTYPYRPVLHDLTPGGVGAVNGSNVANVIYPTSEWYDLYLANIDPAGSHPYHLHAMDMHIVAEGKGLPTPENLAKVSYNTANPLRRDTIVVPPASFTVIRLRADIPGAWIVHCHIGWHIAAGFAGVVIVQPDVIKQFQIPKKNLDLCEARVGPLDTIEPGL
ncbi:sphingosine N-acyltransferase lac1 [Puccinia graminis f. sp. tritici]|uniref:Sphingosine N-acyltransferase lac1 n=2 Tax=Puccinia graminis f. sp. tritici TaxID=56615 RepID=A0A5B0QQ24_PUCGR|nr:sphingosine N-acyltransferase lac1 [Puccinia graminis f. sp. tritici]